MSVQLKRRRDTAANVAAYIGAQGELIIDTTNNRVTLHDGVTPGGWPAAKLSEVAATTRTTVADASYAAQPTDRTIAYTSITAARIVSLPAASTYPVGATLRVMDESGAASATRTITLDANGSDTVNGAVNAVISSAYGYIALQGNGAGKWTIVDQATSHLANVGIGAAADPNNALSVYGASALFNGANFNFTVNKSTAANTASVLFQTGDSGRAQVGLCGDDNFPFKAPADGATWAEALTIAAATGKPSFPKGIASGEAVGFRNRLRNASFAINQRGVSGTVTLAAGAYGHDGVRAGSSGATYTFAATGIDTTITITAGTLILPIEANMIEGGSYTLSQAGAAQARVWQGTGYAGSGTYAACPLTVNGQAAATQTNIEFSTGTLLRPQFEPGAVATSFERRPHALELTLCQRFYQKSYSQGVSPGASQTAGAGAISCRYAANDPYCAETIHLKVTMRAAPAITLHDNAGNSGKISFNNGTWQNNGAATVTNITDASFVAAAANIPSSPSYNFDYTANAEL
jgi:hypothetical protein